MRGSIKLVIINIHLRGKISTKLLEQAAKENTKFTFTKTGRLRFS